MVPEPEQTPPQTGHKTDHNKYVLRLYVAGRSSNSSLALRNLTRFCEMRLRGRYELRVIDVLKEPEAAGADGIVATPTLIKRGPAPMARMFGVLGDAEELAVGLGMEPAAATVEPASRGMQAGRQ